MWQSGCDNRRSRQSARDSRSLKRALECKSYFIKWNPISRFQGYHIGDPAMKSLVRNVLVEKWFWKLKRISEQAFFWLVVSEMSVFRSCHLNRSGESSCDMVARYINLLKLVNLRRVQAHYQG